MSEKNVEINQNPGSMTENLGIEILSVEAHRVTARMPVDHRTCQPFGALNGGASLALAEIISGMGSALSCKEDEFPCGVQVSANHIKMAPVGMTVTGVATCLHRGRRTHVWNVDVLNPDGELISTARVVNQIVKKPF